MSQTERFAWPNTASLSNSRVRLVCERIRSIRGTRLLPPDIEREFTSTRRPSASELILTCHSVMAYARSPCLPSRFRSNLSQASQPSPSKSPSRHHPPNPPLQSIRKAAYSVDLHADSINLDTYSTCRILIRKNL